MVEQAAGGVGGVGPVGATSADRWPGVLSLSPDCPFRPVDWRWHLARCRVQRGFRAARRWDDDHVRRLARLLRAGRRRDLLDPRVAAVDPPLAAAVALRRRGPAATLPVELRLLAGMDHEAIAAAAALDPAVVAAYAASFFDVADRLDAGPWVVLHAVDPAGGLWKGTPNREAVARLTAYQGGPTAAEAALEWLLGPAGPRRMLDDRLGRLFDARHLALSVPADDLKPAEWLRLGAQMDRIAADRRAAAPAGGATDLPAAVVQRLDALIAAAPLATAAAVSCDGPDRTEVVGGVGRFCA